MKIILKLSYKVFRVYIIFFHLAQLLIHFEEPEL